MAVIRRQLGHAGLPTTIVYLDHVAALPVLDAIGQRSTHVITSEVRESAILGTAQFDAHDGQGYASVSDLPVE